MTKTDINHRNTSTLICPFCGDDQGDQFDKRTRTWACMCCNRRFAVFIKNITRYTSEKFESVFGAQP